MGFAPRPRPLLPPELQVVCPPSGSSHRQGHHQSLFLFLQAHKQIAMQRFLLPNLHFKQGQASVGQCAKVPILPVSLHIQTSSTSWLGGSLNKNGTYRLIYLNSWYLLGGAAWKGLQVCHGQRGYVTGGFEVPKGLATFPECMLFFLILVIVVIQDSKQLSVVSLLHRHRL